jgi:hypothetical protein
MRIPPSFLAAMFLPIIVLAGCAARPTVREAYSGSLSPLQSGWSRVYVSAGKSSGIKMWSVHQVGPVEFNGQLVGHTSKDEHFVLDVLPGTYEASCSPQEPDKNFTEKRQFTFAAGETKYLACDMAPKGAGMYFGLIGALASTYLTKTYLTDAPLEVTSKLVGYTRLSGGGVPVARLP